jgi:hypothetical protein
MDFRKRDILVIAGIWVGVFALAVVVGVFIADDDPKTSDGAAMAPFVGILGALLTGLYILLRERSESRRRRLAEPPREAARAKEAVPRSASRLRDNWKQLALAGGLWIVGTVAFLPVLAFDNGAMLAGGLLPLGVLLVLHRRQARQRE